MLHQYRNRKEKQETRIMNIRSIKTDADYRAALKDIEPIIGKSNRVYEILNHKRSLTLKMIWKLHEGLGIPAESLIKPPQVRAS